MAGVRTGLDYSGVESAIRMGGHDGDGAELFAGIRIMEHAALEVFAEQAEAAQRKSKSKSNGRR